MYKVRKVVKGLKCCFVKDHNDALKCVKCPYKNPDGYCTSELHKDALEFILEKMEGECDGDFCELD